MIRIMKKETLLEIILGTSGGLTFAIGMVLGLMKEWNTLIPGIIVGIIGFIILLCIIPVYRKAHPKKETQKNINKGLIVAIIIAIIGALIMGFGMSKVMVDSPNTNDMILGIVIGIIGLIICVLDFPIYTYLKQNK